MKTRSIAILLTILLLVPTVNPQSPPTPVRLDLQFVSQLLVPIITPDTSGLLRKLLNVVGGVLGGLLGGGSGGGSGSTAKPVDMKVLILSTDGSEPGLAALRFFLDYLGTPYQVVRLAAGESFPALDNGAKGFYQGIILTSGNLGICDPGCRSALTLEQWVKLDQYMLDFNVRTVSYYTFPEPRYGLNFVNAVSTSDASPAYANLNSAGASVFPYLRTTSPVKIVHSYVYLATAVQGTGETTTPLMTVNGYVAGVTHRKADGREYMALTMDNNPFLTHSALFHHGVISWVTKGIFLGSRKIYLTPQVDDLFLPNTLYDGSRTECKPTVFSPDPRNEFEGCPELRITGPELASLAQWQNQKRSQSQFSQFRVSIAFNGFGATAGGGAPAGDSLLLEAFRQRNQFFWINHTWDHQDLDCFEDGVPCRPATQAESNDEISRNNNFATLNALPLDRASMVTPGISGLNNPAFLAAAYSQGVRYLIGDLSRPEGTPAAHNTGIKSQHQPAILIIPRRPTNVFYNVSTAFLNVPGSLPDEYNYFYGPQGIFGIGGPGGPPFFTTNQTWAEIANRESETLLGYMLRGEMYPTMFHQSNLHLYSGSNSLFGEVIGGALSKFAALSSLPVVSMKQSDLGVLLANRMGYNASQVQATLTPGKSIKFTTTGAAKVPVTGVCSDACETYGPARQSTINLSANSTRTIGL